MQVWLVSLKERNLDLRVIGVTGDTAPSNVLLNRKIGLAGEVSRNDLQGMEESG